MKIIRAKFILITIVGTVLLACNKQEDNTPPQNEFDRKALLTNVANNMIKPGYESAQARLNDLNVASDAFVADPNTSNLTALRAAWRAAYLEWQKVEQFSFGPADQVLLRNHFNIYPTDTTLLKSHVVAGQYNLDEISNNKVQGFPALDYLINGIGNNDDEIVARYTSDTHSAGYKQYLQDVITKMSDKLTAVVDAWNGTYGQDFVNNTGTGAGSSLSIMTNEYIMHFERFIRSGKFAIPAGVMSGTAAPEKVEAYYSPQLGGELALQAIAASRDFYVGKAFNSNSTGASLQSYLEALGQNNANVEALANNIEQQFSVLRDKTQALGPSIYDAISNNRTAVLDLYDEFQEQVRYLKVDMASAIGITISYTDNDGD